MTPSNQGLSAMAKTSRKKELTFKPNAKPRKGGRWCKKINGRTEYFGPGNGKSDDTSYRAALKAYRKRIDVADEDDRIRQLSRAMYQGLLEAQYGKSMKGKPEMIAEDIANGALDKWDGVQVPDVVDGIDLCGDDPNALSNLQAMIVNRKARDVKTPAAAKAVTIKDHVDVWLRAEAQRVQTGDLSAWGIKSKRLGIKSFVDFAGKQSFDADDKVEALLSRFRDHLIEKNSRGQYSANTINDKLKFLRQFINWAFSNRVLSEMPRNLKEVAKRVPVKKSGQPLSLADICKLWRHADSKMRCWIALGLNCGFKNSDIAGLKADDLSNGRIIGRRGKTDVPMNYKLWSVTVELIEQTRMDREQNTGGLLYVNAEGNPVVTESGSDRVGHAFKKLAKQAGVECTFQQLRDTGAQAVKDLMMKAGDYNPALVQLYLAHKDNSTAAFYLSDDPCAMVTKPLDEAIDRLDDFFKLDADQPTAQRQV